MRSRAGVFDAVVSADTLVYFGALEEPLSAARTALCDAGLLIFTLESLPAESSDDFRLEDHGRYAHSERYIQSTLADYGFSLMTLSHATLREERGKPVDGVIVVSRKS